MSKSETTRRYRRRTMRVTVEYLTDAGPCRELATTLGAGGLFIDTEVPSLEASTLKLRFQLPGSEIQHDIEGRVVWTRRATHGNASAAGMGVEFTDRRARAKLAKELRDLD
jgi:uncharacterized protein (TIGR02266 family)